MPVPEAAVDEYNRRVAPQNYIRRSRERFKVQSKPKPQPMKDGANGFLGRRVGGMHSRHIATALLSRDTVHYRNRRPYAMSSLCA